MIFFIKKEGGKVRLEAGNATIASVALNWVAPKSHSFVSDGPCRRENSLTTAAVVSKCGVCVWLSQTHTLWTLPIILTMS